MQLTTKSLYDENSAYPDQTPHILGGEEEYDAIKKQREQYVKTLSESFKAMQGAPGRRQTLLTTRSQDLKNLTLNNLATLPEYKWM